MDVLLTMLREDLMGGESLISTQAFFWNSLLAFFLFGGRESGLWPELVLFTDA
jgi:hypothetical protein